MSATVDVRADASFHPAPGPPDHRSRTGCAPNRSAARTVASIAAWWRVWTAARPGCGCRRSCRHLSAVAKSGRRWQSSCAHTASSLLRARAVSGKTRTGYRVCRGHGRGARRRRRVRRSRRGERRRQGGRCDRRPRAAVADLVGACSAVRVLATSRVRLLAANEVVYPVPGMSTDGDAVALFATRAAAGGHREELAHEQLDVVREICQRLDGMAPAIELAAARVSPASASTVSVGRCWSATSS